jgi:hypothetical protein
MAIKIMNKERNIFIVVKILLDRLTKYAKPIAITTKAEASARVPEAIKEKNTAKVPRTHFDRDCREVKKALNAEKNKTKEIYDTPEGFVLAIRKTPKGTEVIRKVTIGTLRR